MASGDSAAAPTEVEEVQAALSSSSLTSDTSISGSAAKVQRAADEHADEGEDDEDDEETASASAPAGNGEERTLSSKQKKKKKSKAAAKLKKKLGLAGQPAGEDGGNGPNITPEMLSQVHNAVTEAHGEEAASKVNVKNLQEVLKLMNAERDQTLRGQETRGTTAAIRDIKDHKFWKTQPVMKANDSIPLAPDQEGPIEPNTAPEQVRQEPLPLPSEFEWVTMDIDNPDQLKEVYDLLTANYVEDDDASLRFNYSADFLHWVLKHPGYSKSWHVGVRVVASQKLVAFISGIPHELRVREKSFHSTEINFLCVLKKLRAKRLAPMLIKEVTRRCHLSGIFQAIYTAGSVLPTPISCARYYHRTINPEKLLSIGFAAVPQGMSKDAWMARYRLPTQPSLPGFRQMSADDVPQVGKLLRRYLRRFDMAPRFSDHEVKHILLSSGNANDAQSQRVVWAYVVEDPSNPGRITDMVSYYSLPSSVLDSAQHKTLNAAYLFYYATDVVFRGAGSSGSVEGSSSSLQGSDQVPMWQSPCQK